MASSQAHPEALANQILAQLQTLTIKIKTDTPLTEAEQHFLESTPLPLYKLLNIQAVLPTQTMQLDIASLAEVIAMDCLEHTLTDSLMTLKAQAQTLSFPQSTLQLLEKKIQTALKSIQQHSLSAYRRLQLTHSVVTRAQLTEQRLANALVIPLTAVAA